MTTTEMSGMDRLTDEKLAQLAHAPWTTHQAATASMARELLAHRRASQAASGGCGYPCGYDCNGACFQAAPAPSDELAQIDAMLMEGQGDDDGDQVLPDFEPGWSVAAKVEACLHLLEKRRDLIAATAPSDGLRKASDRAEVERFDLVNVAYDLGEYVKRIEQQDGGRFVRWADYAALRERAEAAEQRAKLAEACLVQPTVALNAAWKAGRDAALLIMNDDPTGKTAVRAGEYPRWFADRYNAAAALTPSARLSADLGKIAQEG